MDYRLRGTDEGGTSHGIVRFMRGNMRRTDCLTLAEA
jgi:hypothetical protein